MKKLIAVLMSMMIVAGILAGCAASGDQSEDAAQTQPSAEDTATTDPGESIDTTAPSECMHINLKEKIIKDASCSEEGEILYTCNECDYKETQSIPLKAHVFGKDGKCTFCEATNNPAIHQVDTLTLTAQMQSENDTVNTTFCLDNPYFYVRIQTNEEPAMEYLYHIDNGNNEITQYLRTQDKVIRNSSIHNEEIKLVYDEQWKLLRTFIDYQSLQLSTTEATDVTYQPETEIRIGGTKLEADIHYYPAEEGYIGVDQRTQALVAMLDSEQQPLMTVTSLNLNTVAPMKDLLSKIDTAALLTPEIPIENGADSYQISCYIPGEDKTLTLILMQNPDGSIVYQNGDNQSTVIYHITADGTITRKPEAQDIDLKDELTQLLELFNLFIDYPTLLGGCQYTQVEQLPNSTPDDEGSEDATGNMDQDSTDNQTPKMYEGSDGFTAYQVLDHAGISYITIDNTTGILTGIYDDNGPLLFVTDLQIGNVK